MIRRWIRYPALAGALLVMWLLLTQSLSPGQLLLGFGVAAVGTWTMAALRPKPSIVRSWTKLMQLGGIVAYDILRSNLAVAQIILTRAADRTSAFVRLRIDLRNEHALAVLALIITATPGTAWVEFDRMSGILVIHVFDLVDEKEWVRLLKTRYEAALLEIFP
jgi:multicomponent K+:H+ antiporter subunit E